MVRLAAQGPLIANRPYLILSLAEAKPYQGVQTTYFCPQPSGLAVRFREKYSSSVALALQP